MSCELPTGLVQIVPVVKEIREVEIGDLSISVNNTLTCHASFLATGTQPCALTCLQRFIVNTL